MEKTKAITIDGAYCRRFPNSKGKTSINQFIHVEKFKAELDKYVNENGYVALIILEKPYVDKHGNDFGVILNTYKPEFNGIEAE